MEALPVGSKLCPEWARPALEKVLLAYRRNFDISWDCSFLGRNLPAMAKFSSRGEKYVLVKKAKLWAMECYEHVLFLTPEVLTIAALEDITSLLAEAERELVKPHSEHMYTYLTAVILPQAGDEEAIRALRRFKKRKNYKLSFYGWSHMRLAVCLADGSLIETNADGKDLKKMLRKTLVNSDRTE